MSTIDIQAQKQLFTEARSQNTWQDKPVADDLLVQLYDLMKWGPTSANCSPARILFLRTAAAKEKLKPFLIEGNIEKTMTAPVAAIIAYDAYFFEKVPQLFPHKPEAAEWFESDVADGSPIAFRNGTLQGAYFMIAARALGLDCGPMSGFDNAGVDQAFFPEGKVKSNFICNLGHGDPSGVFERLPRLAFDEACQLL